MVNEFSIRLFSDNKLNSDFHDKNLTIMYSYNYTEYFENFKKYFARIKQSHTAKLNSNKILLDKFNKKKRVFPNIFY